MLVEGQHRFRGQEESEKKKGGEKKKRGRLSLFNTS
jgi:nickel-dependent lactate racemase